MGCPAGHFHDYENVGKVVNNENIVNRRKRKRIIRNY
jgi:hypothetical protein